ncbi:hypothetical protein [Polaribacter sp.]|uniref:hypothetical protein n=1 Tax=Polaribacter sp. TaxID=1920175 RepID=UPI003F6D0DFD
MKEKKYNSEITKEDLKILGNKNENLRRDGHEDQYLKNRDKNIDFSGKNLDIPGRNSKNHQNEKVLKDEENKHFSLGSEDNENLEINTITKK